VRLPKEGVGEGNELLRVVQCVRTSKTLYTFIQYFLVWARCVISECRRGIRLILFFYDL